MIIPNLSVNPVVSISQLKQNSQLVIDWLTNNDQPIILIQGSSPVALLCPFNNSNLDPMTRKKAQKSVAELRKMINAEFGNSNNNPIVSAEEVDKYTYVEDNEIR